MKAILSEAAGGPDTLVLRDCPVPRPGRGEVLIAVHAVGVNYPDVLIIEDKYQYRPERPFSPGAEVSGTIEAIGSDVEDFAVGDRVLAMLGWGGMAEYAVAEAAKCVALPASMPFDEAASFIMTYGTSYHALKDRADLKAGETLLVLGAAGGVGLAAVELGKAMGARVVAAVSSPEKSALVREKGADACVIYPSGPLDRDAQKALSNELKAACGQDGANVIYDPVGGDYTEPALRAIAWLGRYLVVGFPAGIPKIPANLALLKNCDIRGVFWGAAIDRDQARHAQAMEELLALHAAGHIRPTISRRFPLARAGEAIAYLASRQSTGKVVVTLDGSAVSG
jgi:NADPH:quinone reductase